MNEETRKPRFSRRRFMAASSALAPLLTVARRAVSAGINSASDVSWLAELREPGSKVSPEAPELRPLLVDEDGNRITSLAGWKKRRVAIRQWWLDFLGISNLGNPPTPKITVLSEERMQGVIRQRIAYEAEPGITTEAYLLKPEKPKTPCPGMAVFHSTVDHSIRQPAGIEGVPEKAFGLELARRGHIAICPRSFLWPDNDHIAANRQTKQFHRRHPEVKGMAKMLFDGRVALNLLASQPEVDPERLGAIGHSLGAKEVLYLAAFDDRVKVTVSSEGGIGIPYSNWDAPWYLGKGVRSEGFDHAHHELLALIAPRPFLLIGGGSADGAKSRPYIDAVVPIYRLYDEHARVGLFNHGKGHRVPPKAVKRAYEWLETYLER